MSFSRPDRKLSTDFIMSSCVGSSVPGVHGGLSQSRGGHCGLGGGVQSSLGGGHCGLGGVLQSPRGGRHCGLCGGSSHIAMSPLDDGQGS
jgi:hypothetical protein